jgi:hypothetical protein
MAGESLTMGLVFPERLLREARQNPNGWVYEIDSHYDPDGRVPFSGIIRAWKVSASGEPTGEVWVNPEYVPVEDT